MRMPQAGTLLLGAVMAAAALLHARVAMADDAERAIRDAAYRFYEAELLTLAKGRALDNDVEAYEVAHRVYSRVRRAAIAWFPATAEWDWEIHLSAELDGAWSAPGCKLMVGTSLARRWVHDEDVLAFVIGHEIAHCTMEHSRMLIDAMVDAEPRLARLQARDLLWMIDGDMRNVIRLAPLSRKLEDDADQLGLILAAAAGYDPAGMLTYFKASEDASGVLARSHDNGGNRRRSLDALVPVARRLYEGAPR